jgi:hypothetical protein
VEQRWAGLLEPGLHEFLELACLRDLMAPKAPRLRHFAEVGVLRVRVHGDQTGRLLLDIDKAELAVVVDGDLNRGQPRRQSDGERWKYDVERDRESELQPRQ